MPGGDYVLVHFGKRHAFDWRPFSPRRRTRGEIAKVMSPLRLEGYEETWFDVPFPVGRSRAGVFWVRL